VGGQNSFHPLNEKIFTSQIQATSLPFGSIPRAGGQVAPSWRHNVLAATEIRERSDSELFTIPIDYETAQNRPLLRIETLHSLRNLRLPVPYVLKSPD
jgi:hypothetical protein